MMKKGLFINMLFALTIAAMTLALMSCGVEETKHTAPYGSTIEIDPPSVTVNGYSLACSGIYDVQLFKITVLDPDNNPMNNAVITVTLNWSPNYSHPSLYAMQLYDGTTPVTTPYTTTTNEYGIKSLTAYFDVSCDYKGAIEAFSGSAYSKSDIDVN